MQQKTHALLPFFKVVVFAACTLLTAYFVFPVKNDLTALLKDSSAQNEAAIGGLEMVTAERLHNIASTDQYKLKIYYYLKRKMNVHAEKYIDDYHKVFLLSKRELREVVEMYIQAGRMKKAERLLLKLIRSSGLYFFKQFAVAGVIKKEDLFREISSSETASDSMQDLRKLVELYEAQKLPQKAISVLQDVVDGRRFTRIALTEKQKILLIEEIAERYTWIDKRNLAFDYLQRVPFAKLSKAKQLLFVLLVDEFKGTNAAISMLKQIDRSSLQTADKQQKKYLADIVRRYLEAQKFSSEEKQNDTIEDQVAYLSTRDFVFMSLFEKESMEYESNTLKTGVQFLRTDFVSNPQFYLEGNFHVNKVWDIEARLEYLQLTKQQKQVGAVSLQAKYSFADSLRLAFLVRPTFFSEYPKFNGAAELSGSGSFFKYYSLRVEAFENLYYTPEMIELGVASSIIQYYAETLPFPWMRITSSLKYQFTHTNQEYFIGDGISLNVKSYLGPKRWQLRIGPWLEHLDWSANSQANATLLLTRNTSVGGLLRWATWGKLNSGYRGALEFGYGLDLANLSQDSEQFYLEAEVSKAMGRNWILDLRYSLFAAGLVQQSNSLTHQAILEITRRL